MPRFLMLRRYSRSRNSPTRARPRYTTTFASLPLTQSLEELREDFKKQVFLKAMVDGRIVGSVRAFAKDGTAFIGRLIVHPDLQNGGIGTELMGEIENQLRRQEIRALHRAQERKEHPPVPKAGLPDIQEGEGQLRPDHGLHGEDDVAGLLERWKVYIRTPRVVAVCA
jgi:GNAT superfamily N-acetyltransferase